MSAAARVESDPYRFCRLFPWLSLAPLDELEHDDGTVSPGRRPRLLSGADILGADWAVQPRLLELAR